MPYISTYIVITNKASMSYIWACKGNYLGCSIKRWKNVINGYLDLWRTIKGKTFCSRHRVTLVTILKKQTNKKWMVGDFNELCDLLNTNVLTMASTKTQHLKSSKRFYMGRPAFGGSGICFPLRMAFICSWKLITRPLVSFFKSTNTRHPETQVLDIIESLFSFLHWKLSDSRRGVRLSWTKIPSPNFLRFS